MGNSGEVRVNVIEGDALAHQVDVLALKYAQAFYGLDLAAYQRLVRSSGAKTVKLPAVGGFTFLDSYGTLGAKAVLFIGVKRLRSFGYSEIREFGARVLTSHAETAQDTSHVGLTIHGANYGLDEAEAFEAEVAGLAEAIASGDYPRGLRRISILERDPARAKRLALLLKALLPGGGIPLGRRDSLPGTRVVPDRLQRAGYDSMDKPHAFVAMPFAEDMEDTFHLGIKAAVKAAGLLCERADQSAFTGDIMDWVKRRIGTAAFVIADLSNSNPNVYLELGYAWGRDRLTVLLARHGSELTFDVRGQRLILYKSIRALKESLKKELVALTKETTRKGS